MALMIRAEDVDALATELAIRLKMTKTDTVRLALQRELQRLNNEPTFEEKIAAIQADVARWPDTGLKADKAFYDDLSGDT